MFEQREADDQQQQEVENQERLEIFKSKHKAWFEDEMTQNLLKVVAGELCELKDRVTSGELLVKSSNATLTNYAKHIGIIDGMENVSEFIQNPNVLFAYVYFKEEK